MYQIKEIKGFPGYRIDTYGQLWSAWKFSSTRDENGHIIDNISYISDEWRKRNPSKAGRYMNAILCKDGHKYPKRIHNLVLQAFIGAKPKGQGSRHLDGDGTNNKFENLCYGSQSQNELDKRNYGKDNRGEKCYLSKLTDKKVRVIKWALKLGAKHQFIADIFKVSRAEITRINTNKIWKHITIFNLN